ncbi:sensor histidine kinase/response regulator hybrid [Pseudomonas aeruginosa]|nr:sensor histidine kinase/response regulator hybrid [Pseudomonas aeruginosa]
MTQPFLIEPAPNSDRQAPRFLAHGGAVGELLGRLDAAASPLGPPDGWPASLRAALAMLLPAKAQIVLFWGAEFIALYNDAYAPSIGDKHPRALGRPAIENWRELWDDLEPLLRGVYETGETYAARDRAFYIERHGGGETVYFDVSYSAVREADGSVGGVLCIVTETTERVRAEAGMRELNESLEERVASMLAQRESALAQLHEARKMEMVGQLTGGIAHDFNNLLTPIMASLELIRRRLDDDRSGELIDGALQAAERARNLVGRLLTFARRQTLKPQATALHELVEACRPHRAFARPVHRGAHRGIRESPGGGGRPAAARTGHPQPRGQCARRPGRRRPPGNRRADGPGGRGARSMAWPPAAMCAWTSPTTAPACPARCWRRCMEPFFSTKDVGKGTGLGLSMVQGLAAQSGGGLGIASEIGKGTRVSIWLPITTERAQDAVETAADAPAGLAADPGPAGRRRQDGALHHGPAARRPRLPGQRGGLGGGGPGAGRQRPGAGYPGHRPPDGRPDRRQLAHELRRRFAQLPVLIVTGYANLTPEQLDGFEVLTKPFRHNQLAERLLRLLEGSG